MSNEDLDEVLGKFVAEMRKEGEKEYPRKTLYEMICCIQAYFRIECKRNITLVDKKGCNFRNLNSALNFQMKQRASAGVGVDVKQGNVISESDEHYLWEHGYRGNGNPEIFRNTLVWVLGLNFNPRAGQEHRNLRMKNSQLSLGIDLLACMFCFPISDHVMLLEGIVSFLMSSYARANVRITNEKNKRQIPMRA